MMACALLSPNKGQRFDSLIKKVTASHFSYSDVYNNKHIKNPKNILCICVQTWDHHISERKIFIHWNLDIQRN